MRYDIAARIARTVITNGYPVSKRLLGRGPVEIIDARARVNVFSPNVRTQPTGRSRGSETMVAVGAFDVLVRGTGAVGGGRTKMPKTRTPRVNYTRPGAVRRRRRDTRFFFYISNPSKIAEPRRRHIDNTVRNP